YHLTDYMKLLDWTGRAILENKRGFIPSDKPPILERLQIDPKNWLTMTQEFESHFKGLVGAVNTLKAACKQFGYRRTPNLTSFQQMLM
ncbi:MAG: transposase, partial [Candidatus Thiodiazotropha sp.]